MAVSSADQQRYWNAFLKLDAFHQRHVGTIILHLAKSGFTSSPGPDRKTAAARQTKPLRRVAIRGARNRRSDEET